MIDKSKEAIQVFNRRAADYAKKFNNIEDYHDGLDYLCGLLQSNAFVLDLACGPGNISQYLLEQKPNIHLTGIDLSTKMIDIARTNNPGADFRVEDIREISQLNQQFDAVVVGFGAPYLSKSEVKKLIQDCSNLLTENGLIYLSTMEGDYSSSGYQQSSDGKDSIFIHYHQSSYINECLQASGFKIDWKKRQPFYDNDTLRFTDYIVIGEKET